MVFSILRKDKDLEEISILVCIGFCLFMHMCLCAKGRH